MARAEPKSAKRVLPTLVLLLGAAAIYGALAREMLLHGGLSAEEVSYLIRSWWYVSGTVQPYTATDATGHMPLFFYQLGWWQQAMGLGPTIGRIMSIGLGVLNGALLFAICQRLTANAMAAAAGVFIFLATPATAVFFATATPVAMVSLLHLAAIWLIVSGIGRPRVWATVLLGVLLAAIYFYRQNLIIGIVVLAPLYIAAIGKRRSLHGLLLIVVMAATAAGVLFAFPAKLNEYARHVPVIYGLLRDLGWLPPNFTLIDKGTVGPATMTLTLDRFSVHTLFDTFLLPYSGTLFIALSVFALVSGPLRILWIVPLYFFWLVAGHLLGSAGYCQGCMLDYMPYFAGVGAFAGAIALAMIARWARQGGMSPALLVVGGAVIIAGLNAFATDFAFNPAYRMFPEEQLTDGRTEQSDTVSLARWVASNAPSQEPVLLIHGLGNQRLPALPWAVFLSGHMMPAQSFDMAKSHRTLNPKLNPSAQEAVQAAIEEESLWTDDTLRRWIERDYDTILIQEDRSANQGALMAAINAHFERVSGTTYRSATLTLFKRKTAQ